MAGWNINADRDGFGTLLGPEKTPGCGCVSWAVPAGGHLTLALCVWVVVAGVGGVWLFVECCIVDASILLWSSD